MSNHLKDLIQSRLSDLRQARQNSSNARTRYESLIAGCDADIGIYNSEITELLSELERISEEAEDKIVMNP